MQTVTLTRQFSGFRNVPDTWIVGANDEKACMIRSYYLPYGYNVGEHPLSGDPVIVDPTGTICDIVTPPPPGLGVRNWFQDTLLVLYLSR